MRHDIHSHGPGVRNRYVGFFFRTFCVPFCGVVENINMTVDLMVLQDGEILQDENKG